jgi:hypothetical protein
MNQSRRAISKEGPAPLRLAFYQAGSAARTMNPQVAAFYHRLKTEHGNCHTQATIASPGNWLKGPGKPSPQNKYMALELAQRAHQLAGYRAAMPRVARMITGSSADDVDETARRRASVVKAALRLTGTDEPDDMKGS